MPFLPQFPKAVNDNRNEAVDNTSVYEASRRIMHGLSLVSFLLSGSAAALATQNEHWQEGAIFGFFAYHAFASAAGFLLTWRR